MGRPKKLPFMQIKKWGEYEILVAVREKPLSEILTQEEKEARINMLKRRYGVKLL